ncbi:MAG TPA: ABC transporter permease [Acidobacteriota bacterium]|jgi:ABC-2 type transport system permease protein|nr:ABC transporter permease [Acidobacteriota bacterium]
MTEIRGIYTLWLREIKRYLRDRARIISSFVQPLLWLVIFGSGIRFSQTQVGNLTPQQYLFPGIVGQTLLFTSMFMGISVIWDREFGFLKEILVAPISRFSVFIGKMLGDSTDAVIQGIIVFVLALFLGIPLDLSAFLEALPIMILITFGLVGIGLTVASFIESLESFGVIQSFINLPLFFLSGALFPIRGIDVPNWLQIASSLNPLTYGVDALRTVILGNAWQPYIYEPLYFDLLVVVCFDALMIAVGTWAFSRRK